MSSFTQTRELERSLIKLLTGSGMLAKLNMSRVNVEWFTSVERKFIVSMMREIMVSSRSVLTRQIFEYEIGAKIADSEKSSYISEWNFIEALKTNETVDILMEKLDEARVGQEVLGMVGDVADLLEEGRIVEALAALKMKAVTIGGSVEDKPMIEITDYQRRLERIRDKQAHPEKYKGMRIGFESFDNHTGGIFINELLLIAGVTGLGKSTLVKQMCTNIIRLNPGRNVLHIANEEHLEQVESKYDANLSGIHYKSFKLADITDEEIDKWTVGMDTMKAKVGNGEAGRIFVKEVPAFSDATLIEQAYRELEQRGIKIDVIIIDHLPHLKPIQQAWGENDERAKAASDCKEIARSLHVAVVVPTQAATIVEEKQNKGKRAGKLDVYGSKAQIHVSNSFMIFTYNGKDMDQKDVEEDWERDVYWLCELKKNRDGPPFWFYAKHFVRNGRVIEIDKDDIAKVSVNDAEAKKLAGQVADEADEDDAAEAKETTGAGENHDPEVVRGLNDVIDKEDEPEAAQKGPEAVKEENKPIERDNVSQEKPEPSGASEEPSGGSMLSFLKRTKKK